MTTSINYVGVMMVAIGIVTASGVAASLAVVNPSMTPWRWWLLAAATLSALVGAFLAGWGR